jgi:hypothetical protein
MKNHLALLIVFIFSGCSLVSEPKVAPKYEVEVLTIEQQALDAVEQTPTDFTLNYQEDDVAWERAHLFFKTYTNGSVEDPVDYPSPGSMLRSKSHSAEKFAYQIDHIMKDGGYRYVVRCSSAKGSRESAERNAKNVARFIREGNLELSFLER